MTAVTSDSWNRSTLALVIWTALIIAAGVFPLRNFVGHPHWDHIRWMVRSEDWHSKRFYLDVLLNVGLFYPFGLLWARHVRTLNWRMLGILTGAGFLLSVTIEFLQIYCHDRHPSAIDVASNTAGTVLGLLTASPVFTSKRLRVWLPARYSHPTGS
mgnify:CR=1 FL=1